MELDAMNDPQDLNDLRLRVDKLERAIAILQLEPVRIAQAEVANAPAVPVPGAPPPPPLNAVPPSSFPAFSPPARPTPSIENRIGSQWFSRIGILALLIATALFLKLAIDNHWIGPLGRTIAGLLGGAALILWSERFRRASVTAFSYALKAIGTGVLYLTLWASFQLYGLIPGSVAFAAMLVVTAWNAYMAWSQDAELLGAYALIGALATPALLSTGVNHEVFLFSYLFAIDLAVVALVRFKPWTRLLLAAFLPTVGYYTAWYFGTNPSHRPFSPTTLFVALFFAVFTSASTLRSRTNVLPRESTIADVLLPLGNAVFTALALYLLLDQQHLKDWAPWLALLLAAVYLTLLRFSRSAVSAAVHLSLAILFITVAIPLKATRHGIVIGWLVEGAALLWVSSRLAQRAASTHIQTVLRLLACTALALGFVGVVSIPIWLTLSLQPEAFTNERFLTGLIASSAFAFAVWLTLKAHRGQPALEAATPSWLQVAAGSVIAFNLVTIWSVVQEINALWRSTSANINASLQRDLAISGFLMLYGAILLAAGFWKRSAFVRWQALILLVFSIGKTFLYDTSSLSQGYRVTSFFALGALLMAVSFAYQKDWLGLRDSPSAPSSEPLP